MTPLRGLTAKAAPLLRDNVDTDTIIPSREMRSTGRTGLAQGLFAPWRYVDAVSREPDPHFVLNRPRYAGAQILVAGRNFGCGSSREHAVWALAEHGIRAVIAVSFAPIFFGNCVRNGLLPASLESDAVREIAALLEHGPEPPPLAIDVAERRLTLPDGRSWSFALDDAAHQTLLSGLDAIDQTGQLRPAIEAFHVRDRLERPWVYLERRTAR